MGTTFATGLPLLTMITPEGSSSSKIFRHFALNSVAFITFAVDFIYLSIIRNQSYDQSLKESFYTVYKDEEAGHPLRPKMEAIPPAKPARPLTSDFIERGRERSG